MGNKKQNVDHVIQDVSRFLTLHLKHAVNEQHRMLSRVDKFNGSKGFTKMDRDLEIEKLRLLELRLMTARLIYSFMENENVGFITMDDVRIYFKSLTTGIYTETRAKQIRNRYGNRRRHFTKRKGS